MGVETRCTKCMKTGNGRKKEKGNDDANTPDVDLLQCGCNADSTLLHLWLQKQALQATCSRSRPLPKWDTSWTFTHNSLPYVQHTVETTSGLKIEDLFQPRGAQILTTASWALEQLKAETQNEYVKDGLRRIKAELEAMDLDD